MQILETKTKMASEGAKARAKPSHPTFLQMAKEALTELAEKPGSSVPKIQTFIAEKYSLDPDSVKVHLKPALAKGLENETFVRPKNSEAKGYTGRFKLNKAKEAEEAKKQKEKVQSQSVCGVLHLPLCAGNTRPRCINPYGQLHQ